MGLLQTTIFGNGILNLDIDAKNFIDAALIVDINHKKAINSLVIKLKSDNLWTKLQTIYPFVGGNAYSHKFNLKDPVDSDSSFRLTYSGTLNHDYRGLVHLGGFAFTQFRMDTNSIINDFHWSSYNSVDTFVYLFHAGLCQFFPKINVGVNLGVLSDLYDATGGNARVTAVTNGDGRGHFIASRTLTSTRHAIYKNGNLLNFKNATSGTLNNINIQIGSSASTSGAITSFSTIGVGLSDAECTNLYNAIQSFQTRLGRQV